MRAIVVEDSRIARSGLLKMLSLYPQIEIVGDADCAETALALIRNTHPELIFLDIHMPGQSGFDLLKQLDYEPKIVFTTAYSDYAIRSFEYNTVDYLLKPISKERLQDAIAKLASTDNTERDTAADQDDPLDIDSRIFVRDNGECHLLNIVTIDYIESCKNYVRLYFDGKNAFVKKSMSQTEARLPSKIFFRANRKYIVNLNSIDKIDVTPSDTYELTMKDGFTLEVSRRNSAALKEHLSL